ncbi:MAG: rod-binding protein [Candidatus Gastranaerophilales bacterium]|nr:rod-binding protein [Candidatus Gastranaerophilales bacterium]
MNNYIGSIGNAYMTNSSDLSAIENIRGNSKSEKEQLKKVASEFESIFVSKMMMEMDKTIDKEGSLFQESKYMDNLKSFMYNQIAREISSNPNTSIGIAKQMYTQLEKQVK